MQQRTYGENIRLLIVDTFECLWGTIPIIQIFCIKACPTIATVRQMSHTDNVNPNILIFFLNQDVTSGNIIVDYRWLL